VSAVRAVLLLIVGIAIPAVSFGTSLEPADPEIRPRPVISFALQSTLPDLPAADTHFGVAEVDSGDPIAAIGPIRPDVLRTGYQTEVETDLRTAARRALRSVVPVHDDVR